MSPFRGSFIIICLLSTFFNCKAFENNYFKQKHVIKHNDHPIEIAVPNQEPEIVSTENNSNLKLLENQFDAKYDEISAYVGLSKVWILAKANGEKTKMFTIKESEKKMREMEYQADDMFINKKNKENVSY